MAKKLKRKGILVSSGWKNKSVLSDEFEKFDIKTLANRISSNEDFKIRIYQK